MNFDKVVDQSEFIFQARIEQLGTATLPLVPATATTAVVLVKEMLRRPPGLGDFSGKLITVQFAANSKPARRREVMIFARGWLYATSIAVKEIGHVRARPSVRRRVIETAQRLLERVLRQRVTRARVIVAGRVKEVRLSPRREEPGTEESGWGEVLLEIASWEKPARREKAIRMVCPVLPNRRLPRAPMFRAPQDGIWMLRPTRLKTFDGTVYLADDPHDFQPLERLELVRRLLRNTRSP